MLLLCVRLGMSRDHRCGHHAAETPLQACTVVRISLCPERKILVYVPGTNISPFVELQFTRNAAIDVAADCLAATRNFEADSAAPRQRTPLLDHVQVAAVRAAWHES